VPLGHSLSILNSIFLWSFYENVWSERVRNWNVPLLRIIYITRHFARAHGSHMWHQWIVNLLEQRRCKVISLYYYLVLTVYIAKSPNYIQCNCMTIIWY
jgi:hypothetical protein